MPVKAKRKGLLTILKDWREDGIRNIFTVCDCGNFNLFKVNIQLSRNSCGCLVVKSIKNLVENSKLSEGEAAFNEVYAIYENSSRLRKYEFKLTKEDFKILTSQNCYYCDSPPSNRIIRRRQKESYTYNGLDRVDNNKGYDLDNVVPCCIICNEMKMSMGQQDFIEHLYKMLDHLKSNLTT